MEQAKAVISPALPAISAFSEEQSAELRDRIFDEFNTLAVVYQQPSSAFVQQAAPEVEDDFLVSQELSSAMKSLQSSFPFQHDSFQIYGH